MKNKNIQYFKTPGRKFLVQIKDRSQRFKRMIFTESLDKVDAEGHFSTK
jgi:hypothetical protein